jgi:hypothetical protein
MVAPAVFVSLYLVVGLVQLGGFVSPATGLAFAETYSLVDTPVLVAVLLLAGFLFYRSYPSSLKTVFGVCATTSAFAILSIELYGIVVSGFAGTPNQSLAVLLYVLNSALDGTVAAALITVGALISRKWTADRR